MVVDDLIQYIYGSGCCDLKAGVTHFEEGYRALGVVIIVLIVWCSPLTSNCVEFEVGFSFMSVNLIYSK